MRHSIKFPKKKLATFCRKHGVKRLAVFGSALRRDFGKASDIDILVEFYPGHTPGFLGITHMERELSEILGGQTVDLRTPEDLSRYFRDSVLKEAEVEYAE